MSNATFDSEEERAKIRGEAWTRAINAYGMAYIFEQRAHSLKMRIQALDFASLIIPVAVGAFVLSFGAQSSYIWIILAIAGIATMAHLFFAVWSVTTHLHWEYAYCRETMTANARYSRAFESLGRLPPPDLAIKYMVLAAEHDAREDEDLKHDISGKDKNMGLRSALRYFQHECVACKTVPTNMSSTECPVCGQF